LIDRHRHRFGGGLDIVSAVDGDRLAAHLITHALTDCGMRQSRCFLHACFYPAGACETTKALKIKRNNVNHYECCRVYTLTGICMIPETKYL
jgi:hypothetical protein